MEKINALRPVEFDWISSGEHCKAGFVAQEVANVVPEIVATSDDREMVEIDSSKLNALMIKAIQEMHDENHNVRPAYLNEPFKHFENLKPMVAPKDEVREVKMEKIPESPGVESKTVAIEHDNLVVIDELGTTIPPITKYDYNDSFSFREKDKK